MLMILFCSIFNIYSCYFAFKARKHLILKLKFTHVSYFHHPHYFLLEIKKFSIPFFRNTIGLAACEKSFTLVKMFVSQSLPRDDRQPYLSVKVCILAMGGTLNTCIPHTISRTQPYTRDNVAQWHTGTALRPQPWRRSDHFWSPPTSMVWRISQLAGSMSDSYGS